MMTTSETREETAMARQPHPVSAGPIVQLPTAFGDFVAQAWTDLATGAEHLAVSSPMAPVDGEPPLVRLHSECLTGDVFGSYRCDCGEQLAYALELINELGGTLLYLRGQEGRGIGLANKMKAYALQEAGFDTVEANEQLGLPVDARCYKAAAQILAEMGLHEIRLLSNNPDKQDRLAQAGVKVVEMVPTEVPSREQNLRYLQTKKDRMDHRLVLDMEPASGRRPVADSSTTKTEPPGARNTTDTDTQQQGIPYERPRRTPDRPQHLQARGNLPAEAGHRGRELAHPDHGRAARRRPARREGRRHQRTDRPARARARSSSPSRPPGWHRTSTPSWRSASSSGAVPRTSNMSARRPPWA